MPAIGPAAGADKSLKDVSLDRHFSHGLFVPLLETWRECEGLVPWDLFVPLPTAASLDMSCDVRG